jgi:hypothetical protein
MGLTPEEYGKMTPGEFKAAKRGYLMREIRNAHQIAQLVAYSFNSPKDLPSLDMLFRALGDE